MLAWRPPLVSRKSAITQTGLNSQRLWLTHGNRRTQFVCCGRARCALFSIRLHRQASVDASNCCERVRGLAAFWRQVLILLRHFLPQCGLCHDYANRILTVMTTRAVRQFVEAPWTHTCPRIVPRYSIMRLFSSVTSAVLEVVLLILKGRNLSLSCPRSASLTG